VQPWAGASQTLEAGILLRAQTPTRGEMCRKSALKKSYLPASEGVRLVGIGLEDLIAVALPDAILVGPRAAAREVGLAVAVMKAKGI